MKNDLVVIVDMVNGFVNFGTLADKKINDITPGIEKLVQIAKKKGIKIVAFKDCHSMEDEEFKTYPPHCLKGSSESELVPELKKYEKDILSINKNTTNGFITNTFQNIISKYDFDNVYVVGCCTDICVKDFALSYQAYLKKEGKKTNIIVFSDLVATFDSPSHGAKEFGENALQEMKTVGIKVVESGLNAKKTDEMNK